VPVGDLISTLCTTSSLLQRSWDEHIISREGASCAYPASSPSASRFAWIAARTLAGVIGSS
jgi:hypothetical protein